MSHKGQLKLNNCKLIIPGFGLIYQVLDGYTYLILQVIVGGSLIRHGMLKLFSSFGGEITRTIKFLQYGNLEAGSPLAYYMGCLKFFGSICLLPGFLTGIISIQISAFMMIAAFHTHLGIGRFF